MSNFENNHFVHICDINKHLKLEKFIILSFQKKIPYHFTGNENNSHYNYSNKKLFIYLLISNTI